MANVAALKKKAADFEQKKQLDKAIAAYREVLDAYDAGDDDNIDVALYNRVGDMLVRQGNVSDGVLLYERAVDLYAEGGFFNNAIALCNKILRTSPGRVSVYYKLGKISAAKGFKADAKANFLEYADRMQKADKMEEAFRALKEFADLVPDQDDIRQMLADHLTKANKPHEALEQLQLLHSRYVADGRASDAEATVERMKSIDPSAVPRSRESTAKAKVDDLVFIDLDAPLSHKTRAGAPAADAPRSAAAPAVSAPQSAVTPAAEAPAPPAAALADLPLVSAEPPSVPARAEALVVEPTAAPFAPPTVEPAVEQTAEPAAEPANPPTYEPPAGFSAAAELMADLERMAPVARTSDAAARADQLFGLEPTSYAEPAAPETAPMQPSEFAALDFSTIKESGTGPRGSQKGLALPGDLPEIDLISLTPFLGMPIVERAMPPAEEIPFLDFGDLTDLDEALARFGADAPVGEAAPVPAPPPRTPTPAIATDFKLIEAEELEDPPRVRRTTSLLATSVGLLVRLNDEPENWAVRRQYAEALLDDGDREGGLRELDVALVGFERDGNLATAREIADEIIRVNPASVKHHQKRVEFALRVNDRPTLVEAYVALGDALLREGQADKARVVYQRVLDIAPNDARARSAMEAFGPAIAARPSASAPAVAAGEGPTGARRASQRYTAQVEAQTAPPPAAAAAAPAAAQAPAADGGEEYVSLGDWLREDEAPKNTRMIVDEEEPTGDEQADFDDMLRKFKQGVAENVEEEDYESHYDLGVAYKEMGLLDEAISEFQKALRSATNRVRTFEALGQCFLEKKQLPVAITILQRATNEPGIGDEQLVGVLYLLGYIHESLGNKTEAKAFYERVFAVDIQFRDVGDRLNAVDKALQ